MKEKIISQITEEVNQILTRLDGEILELVGCISLTTIQGFLVGWNSEGKMTVWEKIPDGLWDEFNVTIPVELENLNETDLLVIAETLQEGGYYQ